jgi:hypothetical protein
LRFASPFRGSVVDEDYFASAEARFFCVDKRTQKPQGRTLDPGDGQKKLLPTLSDF